MTEFERGFAAAIEAAAALIKDSNASAYDNGYSVFKCPTCKSEGFKRSILPNQCTFCDGTEGGNPPLSPDEPVRDDERRFEDWFSNFLTSDGEELLCRESAKRAWNAALEAAAKVCDTYYEQGNPQTLHGAGERFSSVGIKINILALRRDEPVSDEARIILRVVMYSMPESNGKRNWTAMFKRTTKFDGLVGNCGGVLIDRGECWNRVAYEAERARVLTGERISEPDIMEYAIDVNTPDEWQGNDPESLIMIKPAHTPNASAEMKRDAARYRRLREQERRRFDNEYKRT